jgi:DNA-binding transcriptional ArsR family regulator
MSMEKIQQIAALEPEALAEVAKLFGVLAEPTRLEVLRALAEGPLCVGDLVERLGAKQANISKQLGILYAAQIVDRERAGLTVRYFIREPMIFELCSLVCGKLRRDAEAKLAVLPSSPRARKR